MADFIPAKDLTFESYKEALKTYMRGNEKFTDYDFDGSNLSVIIDLLAYNTYNNGHYLNMTGSEMWLDSAQIRESVVSRAKELNYIPRSRSSARCTVDVEVTPNDSPSSITIPKHYQFRTSDGGGKTLYFVTQQAHTANKDENGKYLFNDVVVYEGRIVKEFILVNGVTSENNFIKYGDSFNIQSENIDTSSIEVYVKDTAQSTIRVKYEKADDLFGLSGDSLIYFLEGYGANNYKIEFGDGLFGSPLINGNQIEITYRDTKGSVVAGNYILSSIADIDGYGDIDVVTTSRVSGGSERESIDSIKFMAPRHFQTQGRAIVAKDYETIILQNFPTIQTVNVYGGEEIYQYGKIVIVMKPYDSGGTISDTTKNQIIQHLKTKNMVIEPLIRDAEYFYLSINGNIFYDSTTTSETKDQIYSRVSSSLDQLNESLFNKFNVDAHQSKITSTINASDESINGSDVELSLVKRWVPITNKTTELNIDFGNVIETVLDNKEYDTLDEYSVSSSVFVYDINGVESNVIIQDNGVGDLLIFDVSTTAKIKTNIKVGSVDYFTGKININMWVKGFTDYISIEAKFKNNSITIDRDKFLIINNSHINLKMVG